MIIQLLLGEGSPSYGPGHGRWQLKFKASSNRHMFLDGIVIVVPVFGGGWMFQVLYIVIPGYVIPGKSKHDHNSTKTGVF